MQKFGPNVCKGSKVALRTGYKRTVCTTRQGVGPSPPPIRLRQQKTGVLLDIPVHPVLRDHLDGLSRSGLSLTIVAFRGRPVKYLRFNERFRRVAERSGIDAQARDLRRTAMLRMAEAGATVPQIASVSGHSIEATQRILETYLPRNRDLAEIAITRLVEYKKQPKVQRESNF